MAAIKQGNKPLQAFMMAAVALPGMVALPGTQADGLLETQIQYGHYEESGRAFWAGPTGELEKPDPFRADTMRTNTLIGFGETTTLGIMLSQDIWSGATPYITSPEGFIDTSTGASAFVAADKSGAGARVDRTTLTPLNLQGSPLVPEPALVNLMASASAEIRNEGRFTLTHGWETFALDVSAGVSDEPDYHATTFGTAGRWDFNQKLSTVSAGLSQTRSRVDADLGPVNEYVDYSLYTQGNGGAHIDIGNSVGLVNGAPSETLETARFRGDREDLSTSLGFSQVLGRDTVFSADFNYLHSTGFLENPHKLVLMGFANPATPPVFDYLFTTLFAMPENRPDTHNQSTLNTHLTQYFAAPDAALHLDYSYSRDDWGIKSQAVEVDWVQALDDGWTVTPRFRYYTQNEADFYQPYFIFREAYPQSPGNPGQLDYSQLPVDAWSSDQRLSGFGARSVGLIISRKFENNLKLEIGFEDYRHAGSLKAGGGGEDSFADFDSRSVNIGLSMDFDSASEKKRSHSNSKQDHHAHQHHSGADAPAGVMNAHMMNQPGDVMVDYSYMYSQQQGDMMHGSSKVSDAEILARCGNLGCPVTPEKMTMQMQMLHVMYAPTENINLMLMTQLVSMDMENRVLAGGYYTPVGGHNHDDMDLSGHSSGGFGDTTAAVLVQLMRKPDHEIHLGLGVNIPTGSVDETMHSHGGEYMDYGMQTGSGTWDFLPSLTYTGHAMPWSWGAQLSGIVREDSHNESGYTLGNVGQGTLWTSYQLTEHVSASLRGLHTVQGDIRGELSGKTSQLRPQHNTTDLGDNYGGRYTDIGLGLNVAVPGREMQGDSIGLEWLAPVHENVNGDQLERKGSLTLRWKMMF